MKKTTRLVNRAIQTTQRICALPAIPSQGWATDVAEAIANLSPSSIVGVLIANLDPDTLSLKPISTGVAQSLPSDSSSASQPRPTNQTLYLQDKLERVSTLGFQIPENSLSHGLVAPFSLLHPHWTTTPIGRIFASQKLQSPILVIVPISEAHPGFVLILVLANNPALTDQPTQSEYPTSPVEWTTEILSLLIPLLRERAQIALKNVNHPKAWLTEREHEILDQLILGHSVRVIAERLGRSAHTVHDHVKNLHKKLDASSRGELIAKALGYTTGSIHPQTTTEPPIVLHANSQLAELKPYQKSTIQAKALHQGANDPTP